MTWASGITVFLCIWWIVIFAILPFGVRQADPDDPAYSVGAPAKPMLWRKALFTTILSVVLWLLLDAVILSGWFSFRE